MDLFFTFIGIAFAIAFSYTEMFIYDLLVVFINIVRFIIQFMFCNKTADVFGKGKYFGIWLANPCIWESYTKRKEDRLKTVANSSPA